MEFDYGIVGGGTTGCVVAARLAENPDISVGLIEGGKSFEHDPLVLGYHGSVPLRRLDAMIARRREIADAYRAALPALGIAFQSHPAGATVNEQTFGAIVPAGG